MIEQVKEGYVKTEHEHGIATIEFFTPKGNALPHILLETLAHNIHSEGINNETKVIVLRSAGDKTFCAGASFDELMAITTEADGLKFFSGFADVINAMRKCGKFIIARVQGKCVGGGVGLAAAADYAIAVEGADVKLSELAVGIGPFVVGPAIERKIGISAFSQLAVDASKWRNADWARRKGLYAELHATVEGMDDSINNITTTLSHSSAEAMLEMKKIFWKDADNWDTLLYERAAISGKLVTGSFTKEFIRKFKEQKI